MEVNSKVLMSSAYLPPVHYFALMSNASEVVIEQFETYPKQSYRNRCEIYSANGKIPLIIPVHKPHGNHTMIKDVRVSNQEKWQILHWRAIKAAYANSPYFLYYQDDLEPCYKEKVFGLLDFNTRLLQIIIDMIGLKTKVSFTDDFIKEQEGVVDYRWKISPKKTFTDFTTKVYYQSFSEKYGFIPQLSIIDLLFNLGPDCKHYLLEIPVGLTRK